MHWHQKSTDGIFEKLKATPQGLSSEEAQKRLEQYGSNELTEKKRMNSGG